MPRMVPSRVPATAVLAIAVLGCDGVASKDVPNTEGTDRIWAAADTYCARKPNGLICWRSTRDSLTAHEPTVFEGVGQVRALALRPQEGCAISDLGMGCFRLTDKQLARGGKGVPEDFVAFGTSKLVSCARGAEGVQCFTDRIEDIRPIAAFGKPKVLHATLRGHGVCAEHEYDLRCFTADDKGDLKATVRIRGVRGARAVRIDDDPGWVLVLDSDGLKFGTVPGDVLQGRPIAEDNEKLYPDGASVELQPVENVKGAKKLTAESSWTYVLDAQGVKSVAMGPEGLEVRSWSLDLEPDDLWQGKQGTFFVAHDGKLRMCGVKDGEPFGRGVRGVDNPKDVAAGEHFTCIVHDDGVSCVSNTIE